MKVVFIYGPPAVGKYTVGRELEKLTGFRLFHNHATVDMVKSVFDVGDKPFWGLVDKYRKSMLREAAKNDVSLIMTFVYAKEDGHTLSRYRRIVRASGGKMYFVRLHTREKVLHERRKGESRKAFHKIKDAKTMNMVLKKYNLFENVPFEPNFEVDNTDLSPRTVAKMIVVHYRLRAGKH